MSQQLSLLQDTKPSDTPDLAVFEEVRSPVFGVDLHCHSTASDGELSPTELVELAASVGVHTLALTDHDTLAGVDEARRAADRLGIKLITGSEVSCELAITPKKVVILHVVALGITQPEVLEQHLAKIQQSRADRAHAMCERVKQITGISIYEHALELADGIAGALTRSHMARALVDLGVVSKHQQAFDLYLKRGKKGYQQLETASLKQTVKLIHASGAKCVLAHPTRYGLSATHTRKLIDAFASAGGDAVELCKLSEPIATRDMVNTKIQEHGLMVSVASDFHGASMSWNKLGYVNPPAPHQRGVWLSL